MPMRFATTLALALGWLAFARAPEQGGSSTPSVPLADHHQHLFSPELAALMTTTPPVSPVKPRTAADLVEQLDAAGIKRAVVLSTAYIFEQPSRKADLVQVAHLASAGSPQDEGAQQALEVLSAERSADTQSVFRRDDAGRASNSSKCAALGRGDQAAADSSSVRLRCHDGCCHAGRRVDGDAQTVAADRRRSQGHCEQHAAVSAVRRGVKTSESLPTLAHAPVSSTIPAKQPHPCGCAGTARAARRIRV